MVLSARETGDSSWQGVLYFGQCLKHLRWRFQNNAQQLSSMDTFSFQKRLKLLPCHQQEFRVFVQVQNIFRVTDQNK